MKKVLKNAILFALALAFTPAMQATQPVTPQSSVPTSDDPTLTVTYPASGTAYMVWDVMFGTEPYQVSLYDLTASQPVTSFNTWNTSATVSSLPVGHTIRYTLQRAAVIVINDLVIE